MIRRGLQFLAALVLLGAAPLSAQTWPSVIQTANLPVVDGLNFNGLWLKSTNVPGGYSGGTVAYNFYPEGQSSGKRVELAWSTNSNWLGYIRGPNNTAYFYLQGTFSGNGNFPTNGIPIYRNYSPYGATGYNLTDATDYTPDPYDDAFPDWESAAVKIPLGFTFAMSFWAAAVALSIGMKWVRDLASAAS